MTLAVPTENNNHNALAIPATGQDQAIARLVEWAEAASAAYELARKLCVTQFVPQQYRGKPEEGTAAILAGAEVGLSPMASLRAFDPIQGTPAPKAITLRAIVQGKGHDIRIDESNDKVATISGRRKGSSEWQTCSWTIERAIQAKFPDKNPNWKTNPAAMLVARATSELCRWIASDAIMGMPYSAEELRDGGDDFVERPRPQRVTTAEILGQVDTPVPTTVAATDDAIAAGASAPWAPGEREAMTKPQQGKMHALFNQVQIGDRDDRMRYVNEVLADVWPGRQVASSSELSKDEAGAVIDALEKFAAQDDPQAGES